MEGWSLEVSILYDIVKLLPHATLSVTVLYNYNICVLHNYNKSVVIK